MASPPEPGRLRHVGRVVDPLVREDGETEPELVLEPEPAPTSTRASDDDAGGESNDDVPRAGRMRERLLERARQQEHHAHDSGIASLGDLDEVGRGPAPVLEGELEFPDSRAPATPPSLRASSRLSPNVLALFGTAMGMAIVASLSAVVLHFVPSRAKESALLTATEPAAAVVAQQAPPTNLVKKPGRNKQPGPWRVKDGATDPGVRLVEGKIGSDAFVKSLQGAGVQDKEAYRLLRAFKDVKSFDKCNKSDRFSALIERATSRLKAFEFVVGPEEVYQAREGADGLLKGLKLDLKVERGQVSGSLVYDGTSFDASAKRAGFDEGLSKVVSKALEGHMSLDELERGDMVRVIVQEVAVLGEFARYSGVEALEIRKGSKDKPFRVYFVDTGGERGYFDAEGRAPYEGGWRKPIPDAPMTSPFNLKRFHPILHKIMPHLGIDFGAPMGTPVGASSFGKVVFAAFHGPTGNLVKIEHPGGVSTGYAHLSRFAEGLKVGDTVKRLQLIGYVGSTGRSTGPHLHFSASRNSEFFDPATLNLDAMRTISKEQRPSFSELVTKYNALIDAIPLPAELADVAPPAKPAAPAASGAPAAPSVDPGAEEGDAEEGPSSGPSGQVAPPPGPPALLPATAAPARNGKPSIYLSDKDLLEMQKPSDDGEVSQ